MRCEHRGVETQDFVSCRKILKTIDGFFIAKQANQGIQELRVMDKQGREQMKLEDKKIEGKGINSKDVLGAQKATIQQQSQLAYERSALSGAELATIAALYNAMPTKVSLLKECRNANVVKESYFVHLKARPELLPENLNWNFDLTSKQVCKQVLDEYATVALLRNHEARDAIKLAMAKAGFKALENAAQGAILAKQADRIKDFMKKIKEKEKPDFSHHYNKDDLFSECLVDPSKEGCILPDQQGTNHDMATTNFSFGGAEGNTDSGALGGDMGEGDSAGRGSGKDHMFPNRPVKIIPQGALTIALAGLLRVLAV